MNTMTSHEVRPLTADELDAVTGGMNATFTYGNLNVEIYADSGTVKSTATAGCFSYEIEHT